MGSWKVATSWTVRSRLSDTPPGQEPIQKGQVVTETGLYLHDGKASRIHGELVRERSSREGISESPPAAAGPADPAAHPPHS